MAPHPPAAGLHSLSPQDRALPQPLPPPPPSCLLLSTFLTTSQLSFSPPARWGGLRVKNNPKTKTRIRFFRIHRSGLPIPSPRPRGLSRPSAQAVGSARAAAHCPRPPPPLPGHFPWPRTRTPSTGTLHLSTPFRPQEESLRSPLSQEALTSAPLAQARVGVIRVPDWIVSSRRGVAESQGAGGPGVPGVWACGRYE